METLRKWGVWLAVAGIATLLVAVLLFGLVLGGSYGYLLGRGDAHAAKAQDCALVEKLERQLRAQETQERHLSAMLERMVDRQLRQQDAAEKQSAELAQLRAAVNAAAEERKREQLEFGRKRRIEDLAEQLREELEREGVLPPGILPPPGMVPLPPFKGPEDGLRPWPMPDRFKWRRFELIRPRGPGREVAETVEQLCGPLFGLADEAFRALQEWGPWRGPHELLHAAQPLAEAIERAVDAAIFVLTPQMPMPEKRIPGLGANTA